MADALGILGTVADLAGLATKIGTSVPGLKKARKRDTSQRAARQGALKTQAAAVGGSQTGFGATRGLALREGLRAASGAARTSADAASTAAAQDEARYVSERDARNKRLASFGTDMTGMAAQVGQGMVDLAAGNAANKGEDLQGLLPDQAAVSGIDPNTGLALPDSVEPANAALGQMPQMDLEDPTQDFGQQEQTQKFGLGMAPPTTPMEAYQAAMGIQPNAALEIAPVMEYKLRVTNLAVQEAERMGVEPASVIAPLMRKLNIDPNMLSGIGQPTEGRQEADQEDIDAGNY